MAKRRNEAAPATPVPPEVTALVQRFADHREAYRGGTYNEAQLRREFIDPLFKALGWDVDNTAGYAEAYKDVIHEDSIRIGGAVKAPDYCFRVGGARKFFLEAKKPSVDIKGDPTPAYQLRRYAWSGKLPLSILTDFEEFAVYDCRVKPDKGDKSSTARIAYYTFDQFTDPKVWGEIASVFAREAILKGSFDRYAQSTKRKKGTAEVDDAFLAEIEQWRDELARNIALRNPDITQRQLNSAVQLTVDRIIFLRICEDRGIEDYGRLQALLNGDRVYKRLFELFEQADQRYNSGLFYFKVEKGRGEPDTLTPGLTIDDKVLKGIIKGLYYPDSPYEFSVLSADILGHVYEQFLGKVIRLTKGHRAQIEEKPEVRKAGGVYYTPTYIVDYIVTHTVGKLLEGQSVKWIGAEKGRAVDQPRLSRTLRVLDPACGSGSFLIGAYQHLLDWHLKWYLEHEPEKWAKRKRPPIAANQRGEYRLTIPERKRILLEHIYGVDIDAQAVEVTKLSLLLKVLEGETAHSLGSHLWYEKERALPDLSGNIKCGNSLIGPDFYDNAQQMMFDEEERHRINAFDWKAEFAEVFAGGKDEGGFDAVIGNPPYVSYSGRQAVDLSSNERRYFENHFSAGGWPTSHGLFVERAVRDLTARCVGFIVPDQVGHLDGYQVLRDVVASRGGLVEVKYWGEHVFPGVITPALTFVSDRDYSNAVRILDVAGSSSERTVEAGSKWIMRSDDALATRLSRIGQTLGSMVADPGVHTGNCSKRLIVPFLGSTNGMCVPVLEGKQIFRYRCERPTKAVDLAYQPKDGEYFTIRKLERYRDARFVLRQTAAYPIVGPREGADYFRNSLLALYDPPSPYDIRYFVGLLNSSLMRYLYTATVQESHQRAFPQVKVRSIRQLPVYWPDMDSPDDRRRHDDLVALVQRMIELNRQLRSLKTAQERTVLQRDINHTDAGIDRLVYALYGLDDADVAMVEESLARFEQGSPR